jgi:hypothetical protein
LYSGKGCGNKFNEYLTFMFGYVDWRYKLKPLANKLGIDLAFSSDDFTQVFSDHLEQNCKKYIPKAQIKYIFRWFVEPVINGFIKKVDFTTNDILYTLKFVGNVGDTQGLDYDYTTKTNLANSYFACDVLVYQRNTIVFNKFLRFYVIYLNFRLFRRPSILRIRKMESLS